jgi:hypothetical protein
MGRRLPSPDSPSRSKAAGHLFRILAQLLLAADIWLGLRHDPAAALTTLRVSNEVGNVYSPWELERAVAAFVEDHNQRGTTKRWTR